MGYEVRLTAKTCGDLNEIVAYIAQDNPLAAERLADELAAEAASLSNYPYRGGVVRRRRNVRRLVHGSYLIVYRVFESNRLIEFFGSGTVPEGRRDCVSRRVKAHHPIGWGRGEKGREGDRHLNFFGRQLF